MRVAPSSIFLQTFSQHTVASLHFVPLWGMIDVYTLWGMRIDVYTLWGMRSDVYTLWGMIDVYTLWA